MKEKELSPISKIIPALNAKQGESETHDEENKNCLPPPPPLPTPNKTVNSYPKKVYMKKTLNYS